MLPHWGAGTPSEMQVPSLSSASVTPGGLGLGLMDWEPEWVPGVGWEPGAGNPNDNLTMFDFAGAALPVLRALRP